MKLDVFRNDNLKKLRTLTNSQVYFGPFTGLNIPENLYNILTPSELIGLYESCLHPIFSELYNRKIENIALVGGNNGYYAAGLSYLYNPKKFIVYEMIPEMHEWIKSWYEINEIVRPEIFGEANETNFKELGQKVDLLLIDCEGYEIQLLNPALFSWQKQTDIVVELHPFYVKNLLQQIASRFAETHTIEIIYDDFNEDAKVEKVLKGLGVNIKFPRHPNHRWIMVNNEKKYTSGIFMFLKRKHI